MPDDQHRIAIEVGLTVARFLERLERLHLPSAMPLSIGDTLGPYRIVAPIGAGGMGEVYRAHDSRLRRDVAVKVLKSDLSNDPARQARFEQEARAAAALNHPNIVSLFDVGTQDGALHIVTELVPGDTLDVILLQGPIPARRLLDIAVQIADGMAAAHAVPLTHRDLKPSNVIVTPEGRAKILDFGLAKLGHGAVNGDDATLTAVVTEEGHVLGTVHYMSPEQATGKEVDTRSDQFSFGAMLHEMATGQRPFARASVVQTMSAIVTDDPPVIERDIPAPLKWIIARCLAKSPGDRYQSTRDLFLELRSLKEHLGDLSSAHVAAVEAPIPAPARGWKHLLLGFAAAAAIIAAAVMFLERDMRPKARELVYTPFSFEAGGNGFAVWSPDGKGVAFWAKQSPGEEGQVYVRYLDSSTATQLTRMPEGGLPVAWTTSGRIVFHSTTPPAGLWTISPVGGEPEPLLAGASEQSSDVTADGSVVAYYGRDKDDLLNVMISAPSGTPARPYAPAPFATRGALNSPVVKFSPDGKQILLLRNDQDGETAWLLPYPADPSNPPRRILEHLSQSAGTPMASWMPDNRRVVLTMATGSRPSQLYLADTVSGAFSVLSSGTTAQAAPAVSPDGRKLIFEEWGSEADVVSMDLTTAAVTPLLATSRAEDMPAWAANGSALAYVTDRNGPSEIWLHKPGDIDRPLVTSRDFAPGTTQWFMTPSLSPDGRRVIYTRVQRGGIGPQGRLWISSLAGGSAVPLTAGPAKGTEYGGSWSPDGVWFVYSRIADGKRQLMKAKTTGQTQPETINAKTVSGVPAWSPTGEWILTIADGITLMSPDGKTERALSSKAATCGFSRDGATVFCLRQEHFGHPGVLFSMPVTGGPEKIVGQFAARYAPETSLSPGRRVTLTPDGRSFTYSTIHSTWNLWMLEGID
jgi:serine/threonine protein kinase/Tol biopolymer transport system component